MKMAEVMLLTNASAATIYRWIEARGFPRGRRGQWDRKAVADWWATNRDTVGRWPQKGKA